MKSTKIIYLPESQVPEIQQAMHIFKDSNEVQLIDNLAIQKEWFENENLVLSDYEPNQQILINGFLALKNHVIDGLIVGLTYPSKDVFKWAIKLVNPDKNKLSSCFVVKDNQTSSVWGDCAFNIEPDLMTSFSNVSQMIELGNQLHLNPLNVALLSYSTHNSGAGSQIEMIHELSHQLQQKYQDDKNIWISDNIQFDAAFNKEIANKKGLSYHQPNIVWFPNLMSGNIGYKMAQHYQKMVFAGPFILGTEYLVSDLSRGATVADIVLTIEVMTALLHNKNRSCQAK